MAKSCTSSTSTFSPVPLSQPCLVNGCRSTGNPYCDTHFSENWNIPDRYLKESSRTGNRMTNVQTIKQHFLAADLQDTASLLRQLGRGVADGPEWHSWHDGLHDKVSLAHTFSSFLLLYSSSRLSCLSLALGQGRAAGCMRLLRYPRRQSFVAHGHPAA